MEATPNALHKPEITKLRLDRVFRDAIRETETLFQAETAFHLGNMRQCNDILDRVERIVR